MPDRDESNSRRPARPLTAPFRGPSAPRALTPPSAPAGRRGVLPPFAVPAGVVVRPSVAGERPEPLPPETGLVNRAGDENRSGGLQTGPAIPAPVPRGVGIDLPPGAPDLGTSVGSRGAERVAQGEAAHPASPSAPATANEEAEPGGAEVKILPEVPSANRYSETHYDVLSEEGPEISAEPRSPSAQAWPEEIWAIDSPGPSVAEHGAGGQSVDPLGEWQAVDADAEERLASGQSETAWYGNPLDSGVPAARDLQVPGSLPGVTAGTTPVAEALELLASRIRSGELTVPGYEPGMGDAAALTAALAAVLGVRR